MTDFRTWRKIARAGKALSAALALFLAWRSSERLDALDAMTATALDTGHAAAGMLELAHTGSDPEAAVFKAAFMPRYYELGSAITARPQASVQGRAMVGELTALYYSLLPLDWESLGSGAKVPAAARRALWDKVSAISSRSLTGARQAGAERRTLRFRLFGAAAAFFLLFFFLEWLQHRMSYVPLLSFFAEIELRLAGDKQAAHRSGRDLVERADTMMSELSALKNGLTAQLADSARRREEMRAQAKALRRARERMSVLVEDLDKAREELRERKKALAAASDKLERSYKEMEQFAYIASHDLKEPLRVVGSFSALLAKRYGGRIDKDADDFIGYISEAANRGSALIEALFSYSRVTYSSRAHTPVCAHTALQKAMFNLQVLIEDRKAEISCPGLPRVLANESQLIQVFQNLLENSLKFNESAKPLISVDFEETPEAWLLRFRDNGIGIPPEQRERIFMVFQRLHSKDRYPGAGIGLALCRRILENHGGRIWAESDGGGSVFFVQIPKNAPEPAQEQQGDEKKK
jgi:signal transduction histidine kinase